MAQDEDRSNQAQAAVRATTLEVEEIPDSAPGWFAFTVAAAIGFQLIRLAQDDPGMWLVVDYASRTITLLLIAFSPLRSAVFRTEPLRVSRPHLLISMPGVAAAAVALLWVSDLLRTVIPDLSVGHYPYIRGMAHFVDLTFGLALVAVHEELLFRRLARIAFARLGDGLAVIAMTSLVFGIYHWWSGVPNMLAAMAIGALLMQLYRTAGALWPAIVVHYVIDLYAFA